VSPTGWDDDEDLGPDHVFAGDGEEDDLEDPDDLDGPLGDTGVARAPICGFCGVTALPAEPANVVDAAFVCDNEDCEAFRDVIG
jgi:hypothetical protein